MNYLQYKIPTPKELIMELAWDCYIWPCVSAGIRHRLNDPGKIIERLPNEVRDILKKLKSSDVENVRLPGM